MLPLASLVEWDALAKVAVIGLIGGVGIVAAFGFALVGLARIERGREQGGGAVAQASGVAMVALGAAFCLAALVLGAIAMFDKS